ncbi:hypothetical protein IFM89_036828 [Coptis chinensis]|uniref:FRIGIDA-like protein n=1 Tax=Coptis chinensis TaxID=261450 RepID=A0A835H1Q9_9MAGN|nr:hypothetical protein IFM89_036828 [Coptis chinensis]
MTPHNPTPPTMKSILSSIESIDTKKESLRKALEDLQSHSSSLSSFTLQWKDLEDHFDSIKQSIQERFQLLQSRDPIPIPKLELPPVKLEPSSSSSTTHPELKKYCVNNDGIGLRTYILNNRKELVSIRDELKFALELASDPGKLVIDAMKGFYPQNNNNNNNNSSKGDKDGELAALRRTCLLLLEQLMSVVKDKGEEFSVQVKESAKKLGIEWKGKVSGGSDSPLEPLAFLQLLASYGLGSEFDSSEVLDLAVSIARRKQAIDLLRALRMPDKIPDFIQKLTSNGKQLEAVKFVYAFELVDKFPPVPLLKDYFKQSKKVAQEIRNKGNHSVQSLNEATAKELAAVKAIIKCIEEHNLESQYPRGILDKRVEQLEKQKASKKRPAVGPTPADKKQQQQFGNKRPKPAETRTVSSTVPSDPPPHLQPMSSFVDRFPPYMSSSAQYGLVGTPPTVAPYMNSAVGHYGFAANPVSSYGLATNPVSYGRHLSPSRSHLYSAESHLAAGLYDRSMGYGGHGMPPSHRSSFYPQ